MTTSAPHLRENLLTPRFYTTEIEKAAKTDLVGQLAAFEAMLNEMEADYNRDHFDRKAPLDRLRVLNPDEKVAYASYLVRSCVSEFSGFLLFKELSRQLQKAGRPELSRLFNLMARDEARHAGFLNRALVAEGIEIDLPALSGKRPITWFPLSWVLYSVYLSEKIGYWRYILIDRHLKAHHENDFAPLFDFFEPWCQDENRHGDIFNMLLRCWPGLRQGLRGRLLSRIFLWSVFLTHSLTVCERGNFYKLLGMDRHHEQHRSGAEGQASRHHLHPLPKGGQGSRRPHAIAPEDGTIGWLSWRNSKPAKRAFRPRDFSNRAGLAGSSALDLIARNTSTS